MTANNNLLRDCAALGNVDERTRMPLLNNVSIAIAW